MSTLVGSFIFDTLVNADAYLSSLQTALDLSIAYDIAQEHPATSDNRAYLTINDDVPSDFRLDFKSFTGLLSNTPKTPTEVINEGFPGDIPPTRPDQYENLELWTQSDSQNTTPEAGPNISQLDDISGNGLDFTQATGVNQPAFLTNSIFGGAAIVGDGANDIMLNSSPFISNMDDYTLGFLLSYDGNFTQTSTIMITFDGLGDTGLAVAFTASGELRVNHRSPLANVGNQDTITIAGFPQSQYVRLLIRRDNTGSGQYEVRINGVITNQVVTRPGFPANLQSISLFSQQTAGTNPFDGKLREFFFYSDAKSDDDMDTLDDYLVEQYNFDGSQVLPTLTPAIEKVSVSNDDELADTLKNKLSDAGDVNFSIENPGVDEQVSGSVPAVTNLDNGLMTPQLKLFVEGANVTFSTSFTLALSDAFITRQYTGTINAEVTIDLNSSVDFPDATAIRFFNNTSVGILLVPAAGVTLTTANGSKMIEPGGTVQIQQSGIDNWLGSGDFIFSYDSLEKLGAWWDFSDASTITATGGLIDGNPIDLVTDKSGNGRDVNPATASERPSFLSSGINGLSIGNSTTILNRLIAPGYILDGTAFPKLTVTSVSQLNPGSTTGLQTIWGTFKSAPLNRILINKQPGPFPNGAYYDVSGKALSGSLGTLSVPHKTITISEPTVVNGTTVHVDGALALTITENTLSTPVSVGPFTIGRFGSTSGGGAIQYYGEYAVIEDTISDAIRLEIDNYNTNKWSI